MTIHKVKWNMKNQDKLYINICMSGRRTSFKMQMYQGLHSNDLKILEKSLTFSLI